jgi:hypothetical protein
MKTNAKKSGLNIKSSIKAGGMMIMNHNRALKTSARA